MTRWLWPKITDHETAKKAARLGCYGLLYIVIKLIVFRVFQASFDPAGTVAALLIVITAAIIVKLILLMSRVGAIAALIIHVPNIVAGIINWTGHSFIYWVELIVVTLLIVSSLRGTFAYHKLHKELIQR